MFLLLVYFSGLDARNLLYQPCFHAYIGFCSWTLTWLSVTVIYVWPFVLKPQLKKKAHFNYSFPAMEEKHLDGFPVVG